MVLHEPQIVFNIFLNIINTVKTTVASRKTSHKKNLTVDIKICFLSIKNVDVRRYDSTGMFHWTPARAIEDCVIVSN